MTGAQITLNPRRITVTLWVVTAILVLLSIAGQLYLYLTPRESPWGIVGLFNVDFEMNIPTFYSVLLLLAASALLALIAAAERGLRGSWRHALHWAGLSLGFFVIGADEFIALHEKLSEPVRRLFGWETMGYLHFAWVVPATVLVAILAVAYLRFLMRLDRSTRARFLVAAALYLLGSMGVEMIGGRYADEVGTWNLTYSMITTAEETLEMSGTVLFIHALLLYLEQAHGTIGLQFGSQRAHDVLEGSTQTPPVPVPGTSE